MSANDSEEEDEAEEQRKIAEGADALLNLAGICTPQRPIKRSPSSSPEPVAAKRRGRSPPPAATWRKASLHQGSYRRKERPYPRR